MFDRIRVFVPLLLMACFALGAEPKALTRMQLNLEEGFRFRAKVASKMRCTTDVYPDERVEYRRKYDKGRERAVTFLCSVLQEHRDGELRVRFRYEWIRDLSTVAGPDAYDSSDPNRDPFPGYSRRVESLDALVGRSFVVRVTPQGEVRGIEGHAGLYRGLRDALVSSPRSRWLDTLEGDRKKLMRRQWEEDEEHEMKEFFECYWPLSEEALREVAQQFFFVWPPQAVGPGGAWQTESAGRTLPLRMYDSWTPREQKDESVVVDLFSNVRTDLNLCDLDSADTVYGGPWAFDGDTLRQACRLYRGGNHPPMYAGQRKGLFTIDPKSGLIQHATRTEELYGIDPVTDPDRGWREPVGCPSTRTETVTIEITPLGN